MSKIQSYTKKIMQMIAKDQLKNAIQEAQNLFEGSPQFYELILQSARFSDLMKSIRMGVIDFENASIEKNKIRYALIDMLKELEERTNENPAIQTEVQNYLMERELYISKGIKYVSMASFMGILVICSSLFSLADLPPFIYNIPILAFISFVLAFIVGIFLIRLFLKEKLIPNGIKYISLIILAVSFIIGSSVLAIGQIPPTIYGAPIFSYFGFIIAMVIGIFLIRLFLKSK